MAEIDTNEKVEKVPVKGTQQPKQELSAKLQASVDKLEKQLDNQDKKPAPKQKIGT